MSNKVSTLSLLMPTSNYLLPRSYHTCRRWEAKLIWGDNPWTFQWSHADLRTAHFISQSYKKPPYLIACGYACLSVSVQSCDEVAPQSHEVFTHCALNPAMMKQDSL